MKYQPFRLIHESLLTIVDKDKLLGEHFIDGLSSTHEKRANEVCVYIFGFFTLSLRLLEHKEWVVHYFNLKLAKYLCVFS